MRVLLRFTSIFFLVPTFLAAVVIAQTPMPVSTNKEATLPPAPAAGATALSPQKAPTVADLPASTPIATLHGVCEGTTAAPKAPAKARVKATAKTAPSKTCQTVITKGEMDSLMDLLIPGANAEQRHGFALNYVRMLAASSVAKEKRLDHDPAVGKELEARMAFTRMQVMASSLYKRVETLAQDVQDSEIQSYYHEQEANFVQGDVRRITLAKAATPGTAVDPVMLKQRAQEIRERAAKGEDFDQLQKEVMANPDAKAPPTRIPTARRATLLPAEAVVFDLKPGEVTPVVDTQGAFEILKLASLATIPLESLRADIKTALTNGHLQLIMKDATKGVTANFDLAYLDLPKAPELFLAPTLRPLPRTSPGASATRGQGPMTAPAAQAAPVQK